MSSARVARARVRRPPRAPASICPYATARPAKAYYRAGRGGRGAAARESEGAVPAESGMSRQDGSAEEKGRDGDDETQNPLRVAVDDGRREQDARAPISSALSLRKMPEGSHWPNTYPWFSNDGCTFASGLHTAQNELLLTDVRTGKSTVGVQRSGEIKMTCLAPDGATFCVAGNDGLALYHLEEKSSTRHPLEPEWEVLTGTTIIDAAFSRDGKHLASVQNQSGLLQVWDIESGTTEPIFELADFAVGHCEGDAWAISYCEELLAVGGRRECASDKRVRLLKVASLYKEQETDDLKFEGHVRNAIFSPSGTRLVVSLDWSQNEKLRERSLVHVFSADNWSAPLACLPNPLSDVWNASAARFSHDGRLVVLGYHSASAHAIYNIWDLENMCLVRAISHPKGYGHGCAFSPADDLLACGCHVKDPHVLHRLRDLEVMGTSKMPGPDELPLSAACASADVIVIASVLEVRTIAKSLSSHKRTRLVALQRTKGPSSGEARTSLFDPIHLEETVTAQHFPMSVDPHGRQFACVLANAENVASVSLRDLNSGDELHRLSGPFDGWFGGVNYSPDGSLVLVFGAWGTRVFDSMTGTELHYFQDKKTGETSVHMCSVDPTGRFLVTTGNPGGTAFIRDLKHEDSDALPLDDNDSHTGGVSFDDSAKRMAYWIHGRENGRHTDQANGQVRILELTGDGWSEVQRSTIPRLGWAQQVQFSPGDGQYLLVAGSVGAGRIMFLDAATGKETEWSPYLRALMLPVASGRRGGLDWQGDVPFHMVRWEPQPATSDSDEPWLVVQAAVGTALYHINVTSFIRAFEEDGNFALEQLHRLSNKQHHDKISTLLARWPHLINVRDSKSGDTVLHLCAREDPISHKAVRQWLSGSARFPLLKNAEGLSPIPFCIEKWKSPSASRATTFMFTQLDPQLPLDRTSVLTHDLVMVGETWHSQLVDFIEVLEHRANYCLFRPLQHRHLLRRRVDDFAVRGSEDGSPGAWDDYDGAQVICDSHLEVLALEGFAGPPLADNRQDGPYARLVKAVFRAGLSRAELNHLMKTKLFRTTTTFKWQAFARAAQLKKLMLYGLHCMLAAATMLFSSGMISVTTKVSSLSVATTLQLLLLTSNTILTLGEVRGLLSLGYRDYFRSIWNYGDILGIGALYVASIAYFQDSLDVLELAGAVGILIVTFSFLEMIQSFERFGLYVVVIAQIAVDIAPFLGILMLLLYGFAVAFAVAMPSSAEYNFDSDGVSGPFVTAYLSMLGHMDPSTYSGAVPKAMMVLFQFAIVVVMMNLLIAIMSDSFEKVMEEDPSRIIDLKRAEAIVDQESMMSPETKQNKETFPRYLQVLQAVNAKGKTWAGLSGKMAELDQNNRILVEELDAKMDAKIEAMQSNVNARLGSIEDKMDAILRAVGDEAKAD